MFKMSIQEWGFPISSLFLSWRSPVNYGSLSAIVLILLKVMTNISSDSLNITESDDKHQ
jgi:hypothetical protein